MYTLNAALLNRRAAITRKEVTKMSEPIRKGVIYQNGYSIEHGKVEFLGDGTTHNVTWNDEGHISYDTDGFGNVSGHHRTINNPRQIINLPPGLAPKL
jgi:hypothetical protein